MSAECSIVVTSAETGEVLATRRAPAWILEVPVADLEALFATSFAAEVDAYVRRELGKRLDGDGMLEPKGLLNFGTPDAETSTR